MHRTIFRKSQAGTPLTFPLPVVFFPLLRLLLFIFFFFIVSSLYYFFNADSSRSNFSFFAAAATQPKCYFHILLSVVSFVNKNLISQRSFPSGGYLFISRNMHQNVAILGLDFNILSSFSSENRTRVITNISSFIIFLVTKFSFNANY